MIQTSQAGAVVPFAYRVERRHAFSGGFVEVRRYVWTRSLEQTIHAVPDALVLNLALTSRPAQTRVDSESGEVAPLARDAGQLLVMIPGRPYRLTAPSGSLRSLHCAIDCTRLETIAGEPIDWAALERFGCELGSGSGIEPFLLRIHEELLRTGPEHELAIQALADLICVALLRRFRERNPRRTGARKGGLASWRMRKILERIHASRPVPHIAELADLCGITPRQLGRAFKTETGHTLGHYIDEVAMERAHRLLTTTGQSLAEIARELGFASADSFAQSFRRFTGLSPGAMRRSSQAREIR